MVKVCRKNEKGGKSWVSIKYGGQVPQKETYYFDKGPFKTYKKERSSLLGVKFWITVEELPKS